MSSILPLDTPQQTSRFLVDQQLQKTAATSHDAVVDPDVSQEKSPLDTVTISDAATAKFIQDNPNISQLIQNGKLTLGKNANGEDVLIADESLAYHPNREGTENSLQSVSSSGTHVQVNRQPAEASTSAEQDSAGQPPIEGQNATAGQQLTPEKQNTTDAAPAHTYSTTLTKADGNQLSLSFTNSVFINEDKDGNTMVYYSDTNKTITYASDGSMQEMEGNGLNADADTIIINTHAGKINTGNGNNLIFNWANDSDITTGSGNDSIILADDVENNTISTGDGEDFIEGNRISNSNIDLGNGDNTLNVNNLNSSTVSASNGNNKIVSQAENSLGFEVTNSIISLGDGNNAVHIQDAENTQLSLGNGANDLKITAYLHGSSAVNIGHGDNTLYFGDIDDGSSISVGNGNNNVTVAMSIPQYNEGKMTIGDGDNTLNMLLNGDFDLTVGNGNNHITGSFQGNTTAIFGHGNNTSTSVDIHAGSSVTFGNGDNNISIGLLSGQLKFGMGNNTASLEQMLGDAFLQLGNGDNNVFIGEMQDNASLEIGSGNNFYVVGNMSDQATITTGNGKNWGVVGTAANENRLPSDAQVLANISDSNLRQIRSEYGKIIDERQLATQAFRALSTSSQANRFRINETI